MYLKARSLGNPQCHACQCMSHANVRRAYQCMSRMPMYVMLATVCHAGHVCNVCHVCDACVVCSALYPMFAVYVSSTQCMNMYVLGKQCAFWSLTALGGRGVARFGLAGLLHTIFCHAWPKPGGGSVML